MYFILLYIKYLNLYYLNLVTIGLQDFSKDVKNAFAGIRGVIRFSYSRLGARSSYVFINTGGTRES
jgi:hypothetical protein